MFTSFATPVAAGRPTSTQKRKKPRTNAPPDSPSAVSTASTATLGNMQTPLYRPGGEVGPTPYSARSVSSLRSSTSAWSNNVAWSPAPSAFDGGRTPRSVGTTGKRILHETARFVATRLGRLPSVVAETLAGLSSHDAVSASMLDALACVVVGSVCFAWRVLPPGAAAQAPPCSQLALPAGRRSRCHASLIAALPHSQGLLAVSSSGAVRAWPALRDDSAIVANLHLDSDQGEVVLLEACGSIGYLACTSTGHAHLITLTDGGVHSSQIQGSTGLVAGIGSWLGLGGNVRTRPAIDGRPVRVVWLPNSRAHSADRAGNLFFMTRSEVTCYSLSHGVATRQWCVNLLDQLTQALVEDDCDTDELQAWLLDVALDADGQFVFLVASTPNSWDDDVVPLMRYALLTVHIDSLGDVDVRDVSVLAYQPDFDPDLQSLLVDGTRLLLPSGGPGAYVYHRTALVPTKIPHDDRDLALLSLPSPPEHILAAGSLGGATPVFISASYGLFTVSQHDLAAEPVVPGPDALDLASAGASSFAVSAMSDASGSGVGAGADDPASYSTQQAVLRAFRLAFAGDQASAAEELTPLTHDGSRFGRAVSVVSQLILDAPPSTDAAWLASHAAALLIRQQLQRKHEQHTALLAMLATSSVVSAIPQSARETLLLHAQLIACAEAVRGVHSALAEADNAAADAQAEVLHHFIAGVEDAWRRSLVGKARDAAAVEDAAMAGVASVFVTVTQLQTALQHFVRQEQVALQDAGGSAGSQAAGTVVHALTQELRALFAAASDARRAVCASLALPHDRRDVLLTSGVMQQLVLQHVEAYAQHSASLAGAEAEVAGQVRGIVAMLLTGFADPDRLDDAARTEYDDLRGRLIDLVLRAGQQVHALELAEQFQDFPRLIQLCDSQGMHDRLDAYADRFGADTFVTHLLHYYLANGKRHRLLLCGRRWPDELSTFLSSHPNLAWIHAVEQGHWHAASNALLQAGYAERQSLDRAGTLFALAKLAHLARLPSDTTDVADELAKDDQVRRMNDLAYALHVQQMIRSDVPSLRLDDAPRPPLVLIELCLAAAEAPEGANRDDHSPMYHKLALELLDSTLVADEAPSKRSAALHAIWSHALASDDWSRVAGAVAPGDTQASDAGAIERAVRSSVLFQVASAHQGTECSLNDALVRYLGQQRPELQPVLSSLLALVASSSLADSAER